MSRVSVWTLFAYMTGDAEGVNDEHRRISQWQIEGTVRWCMARGYDHIYLSRDPAETTRFSRAEPAHDRHRMHLVEERDATPGDAA